MEIGVNKKLFFIDQLRFKENNPYKTSIVLHNDGCSFMSKFLETQYIPHFSHYPNINFNLYSPNFATWIQGIKNNEDLYQVVKDSRNLTFYLYDYRFILVPTDFYKEAHKEAVFEQQCELRPNEELIVKMIPSLNAHIIFPVNKLIPVLFKEEFNDFDIHHYFESYYQNILAIASQKEAVYINYSFQQLDFTYLKNGKLNQHNNFQIHNKEDFLYYVLFALEQLNLKQEMKDIYFSGEVNENDPLLELIKKYLPNYHLAKRKDQPMYAGIKDLQKHHFHYIL